MAESIWSEMTPQQKRLQILADSRAWGPFTREEQDHLDSILRTTKRQATPPDFTSVIRYAERSEHQTLRTLQMPGE